MLKFGWFEINIQKCFEKKGETIIMIKELEKNLNRKNVNFKNKSIT